MLLTLLRGTLTLGITLATVTGSILTFTGVDHPTYPTKVEHIDEVTAPAVLIVGGGALCSATLVAPTVALTAGHCVSGARGEPRELTRAYVTATRYFSLSDNANAAYDCTVDRSWTPGSADGADDWGLIELTDCTGDDGRTVAAVGDVVGYHPPAPFAGHQDATYIGYPSTDDDQAGILQRLDTDFTYRPTALWWFHPLTQHHFTCTRSAAVTAGGSGGGVIVGTGDDSRLVAVNNFLIADSHACFRKVDAEIVDAVNRAADGHWPPTGTN